MFDPQDFNITTKPFAGLKAAIDARSQFKDKTVTPAKYRDYVSTAEVLAYLDNANIQVKTDIRSGHFPIYVNNGGTVSNGVITGGITEAYWFKNGTTDADLVLMEAAIEISDTFANILPGNQKRLIYVTVDENNNNDSSLYIHIGSQIKFLLTIPAL